MSMLSGGNVYEKLGVRAVINAHGNQTVLGGSTPPQVVRDAMDEADATFVEMRELLDKAGQFIGSVLGTEYAYVTSGCAAALTLSTAGCMAGTDPDKVARLPDTTGMKNEIILQQKQRYGFDRCFTLAGGKLVTAGDESGCTAQQLEEAIGPNTAAVAYYVQPDWDSSVVSLEDAVEIAHRHDVPVIADAASQIYPLDYMSRNAKTADLTCFGAKYFGAPHSSGIVAGKRDLVEAVATQGFIAYHHDGGNAFGRPMKLDRQEIVGAVTALDSWFSMNHEDRFAELDRRMFVVQEGMRGLSGVDARPVDNQRFFGPTLHVTIDAAAVGKTAGQVADELDAGNPRIWVDTRGEDNTLLVNVHTLNEGEEEIVARRLREVLAS